MDPERTERPVAKSVALVTSMAITLPNFRGVLIARLVAQGMRVYALAPDYDPRTRERVLALGAQPVDIALDRAGMRPGRDLWDLLRLARQLRGLGPDVVLAYFAKPVIYGTVAAWLAGVPSRHSLVAGLGYVFTEGSRRSTLRRRVLQRVVKLMYRSAFALCDRVFFQNVEDASTLMGGGVSQNSKVRIVRGTGVDLASFSPAPPLFTPITFLLMARLLREKGISEFVEAARLVKAVDASCRFVLLGAVDLNPGSFTETEVAAWVSDGTIEWPGHVEDVRPWLQRCSIYVLPSYREGVPRSTQEAMAMSRPVITTDAVGCRDTVENGVNGFVVPVRDPESLAKAMLRFVEQPSLIESMGQASRRLAEERFDIQRISSEMLSAMGLDDKGRKGSAAEVRI